MNVTEFQHKNLVLSFNSMQVVASFYLNCWIYLSTKIKTKKDFLIG